MTKKKTKEVAIKAGGALKDILVAAATHPTTAAIGVMSLCVIGQLINGNPSTQDKRRWETRAQLDGLYKGAQGLGLASAVAPVAIGALGIVKEAIKKPTSGYP